MTVTDNVFTGTTGVDVGFTPREYHTAHMPDFAVPSDFEHTPPADKPTEPDDSGLTESELAEVETWKTTWVTPSLPAAVTYTEDYMEFKAALNAWRIANKAARLTQWRILIGDALIYNRSTTSRSSDDTGGGSDPPPPAVHPRNDP